ncbi:MAG TPA: hypothetical protein VF665_15130, partial [Longimicrobium sp.]
MNTVLWGGGFNGIIPVYSRIPRRLAEPGITAKIVIDAHLNVFLPDYVVSMNPELANLISFPKERILTPADVLAVKDAMEPVGFGVDVRHLYTEIYEKEFKFQRRHPAKVALPAILDRSMALFSAACYGEFPDRTNLRYLRESFMNVFEATELLVGPDTFLESLDLDISNPRRITSYGLELQRLPGDHGPCLFYMDATSVADIIDFWNIRALGRSVLPIPIQWVGELRAGVESLVRENHPPKLYNPAFLSHTTMVCSRSLDRQVMLDFVNSLTLP